MVIYTRKEKDGVKSMFRKIGFSAEDYKADASEKDEVCPVDSEKKGKKSLVKVFFPARSAEYTYYNDSFNLNKGDIVYVEGKLEGVMGIVREVKYKFKIKLSDYKKVLQAVSFKASGSFYMTKTDMLTFTEGALSYDNVRLCYIPPLKDDDEFVSGDECDEEEKSFLLSDIPSDTFSETVVFRGTDYFYSGKVVYLELDGKKGRAIVEGTKNYEVEFRFNNGEISSLLCTCYCTDNCKHEYAVLMKLKRTLEFIEKEHKKEYEETGYFSVMNKIDFLNFGAVYKDSGKVVV